MQTDPSKTPSIPAEKSIATSGSFGCLSCGELCSNTQLSCPSCLVRFPWSDAVESLRADLKEREVSRIRATSTLVSEIGNALQGRGTVSTAAIKGFVLSWILPRATIVIGSLLATALLGFQTYILWKQTKLFELQARAAQIEERERLGERQAAIAELARRIGTLKRDVTSASFEFIEDGKQCRRSTACTEPMVPMLWTPKKIPKKPQIDEAEREVARYYSRLSNLLGLSASTLSSARTRGDSFVSEVIDPANLLCTSESSLLNSNVGKQYRFLFEVAYLLQNRQSIRYDHEWRAAIALHRTVASPNEISPGLELLREYSLSDLYKETVGITYELERSLLFLQSTCVAMAASEQERYRELLRVASHLPMPSSASSTPIRPKE